MRQKNVTSQINNRAACTTAPVARGWAGAMMPVTLAIWLETPPKVQRDGRTNDNFLFL